MRYARMVHGGVAKLFAPVDVHRGWAWANPVMFVVGAVVCIFRVPSDLRFLLWAEDGNTFLAQAYERGGVNVIFTPYAGYMHLVPRLSAWLVRSVVPFVDSGIGMAVLAALVSSACAIAAFHWSRAWLSTPAAGVLWAFTLLIPAAALELGLNVADSHWWLMFAAFWALMSRDRGRVSTTLAAVTVCAAALSDPLSVVLLPLAIVRLIGWTSWRVGVITGAFAIGLIVQLFVASGTERHTAVQQITLPDLINQAIYQLGFSTVVGGALGDRLALDHPSRAYWIGVFVLVATTVGAVLVARKRPIAAIALIHGFAFYAVIQYLVWPTTRLPGAPTGPLTWGQRYAFDALLLIGVAVIAIADAIALPGRYRAWRVGVAGAMAALLLWAGVVQFQTSAWRQHLPDLADQLPKAVSACESGAVTSYPFYILPTERYTWPVSCDVVRQAAR
jgi:hypothetical protein